MRCPRCGKDNPAEVHTCFPLALKLATELMAGDVLQAAAPAAAELRRLHAENAELTENLEKKSVAIQRIWKERDELRNENEALLRQALYLIEAWERGAASADYWFEIAALRERLK